MKKKSPKSKLMNGKMAKPKVAKKELGDLFTPPMKCLFQQPQNTKPFFFFLRVGVGVGGGGGGGRECVVPRVCTEKSFQNS